MDNEVLDKQLYLYMKQKWRCGPTRSQYHSVSLSSTEDERQGHGHILTLGDATKKAVCHFCIECFEPQELCRIVKSESLRNRESIWAHIHFVIDNGVWL